MPGVTTGDAEAGAEVVAALVAGLVAGVLSGADQASYLLDLQIALHPTNHNCTTRGAIKSYNAKGNYFFFASSSIFFQILSPKVRTALSFVSSDVGRNLANSPMEGFGASFSG